MTFRSSRNLQTTYSSSSLFVTFVPFVVNSTRLGSSTMLEEEGHRFRELARSFTTVCTYIPGFLGSSETPPGDES